MISTKKLRELRERKHLSQSELAKACGIGRMTYQYFETGKRIPSSTTMMKIASFYGLPVEYFYREGDDDQNAILMALAGDDLARLTDDDKKAILLVIKQILDAKDGKK